MSNTSDVHDAIVAVYEKFMSAFSQGDPAGIAALYTENGQLLPPNIGVVTGKEAMQAAFQSFMDMGLKAITLEPVEVEAFGDTATDVGTYTLAVEGGQVVDEGKYMVIWKQEAGQWKLHRDMFNTSLPAPE